MAQPRKVATELPRNVGIRLRSRLTTAVSAAVILFCLIPLRRPSGHLPSNYALCSNGRPSIYTVDESKPLVQCIVVHEGVISDTGSRDDVQTRWGGRGVMGLISNLPFLASQKSLHFINLKPNQIVVPGFVDSHAHILDYGWSRDLDLSATKSIQEIQVLIRKYILDRPDLLKNNSIRIDGSGWDQNAWNTDGGFPTASDLDWDILRDRPIVLARKDGHAHWISHRMLNSLGHLPDTIDGGHIVRDANGSPTGIFVDNAMGLIPAEPWSEAAMTKYFAITTQHAVAHGLTSIHDANATPANIKFFKRLADEGKIPIRLYLMGSKEHDHAYWGGEIERMVDYGGGRLTVRSVKLFTDGALGSSGAAMLEPYSDDPNNSGLMRIPPKVLDNLIHRFLQDGWQVNVHCIGDRANHIVLNALESALPSINVTASRPRIEHAQILTPDDLKRIGRLGVIASVQPTHADMLIAEKRLGPERIKAAYAYRTLLRGGPITLGSDFPVEEINPLLGFYAAVTRLDVKGDSPHGKNGWFPNQRLTRAEALKGMTLDAAYASFTEHKLGSLSPSKIADYVVLNTNIMDEGSPAAAILSTKVEATAVDGQLVYGKL